MRNTIRCCIVALLLVVMMIAPTTVHAEDTSVITILAEASGTPLSVQIYWSYEDDTLSGGGTTPLILADIPNCGDLLLHAPMIHIENSKVYSITNWDGYGYLENEIVFEVSDDSTQTVFYEEYENYVTGGGQLDLEGNSRPEYSFGGVVGVSEPFGIAGTFTIVDHTGEKAETWQGTSGDFWLLLFEDWGEQTGATKPDASNDWVEIRGTFSSNRGSEDLILDIVIWDNSEPGTGYDTIEVYSWDDSAHTFVLWFAGTNPGINGNFQIHNYE